MNVYDFDKTIYDGDSTMDFYHFCLKRHKGIFHLAFPLVKGAVRYYVLNIGTKTIMKENMYRFLTKIDAEKDIADFWKQNKLKIKTWYKAQQKHDDLVISASPYFLLKPICDYLGIKRLIASRVDVKTGKYTGENCHGDEKVKMFKEQYGDEIDEFYSDSYNDEPLAKMSKKAFLVKGSDITEWQFKNKEVRR